MIVSDHWQANTLEQLTSELETYQDVIAAVLIGSLAQDDITSDMWSDIDLVLVVENDSLDHFYPGTKWLHFIGPVFAVSNSDDGFRYTSRICFMDMKRIDFIFIPVSSFHNINNWSFNPLQNGHRVLFSRSQFVPDILRGIPQRSNRLKNSDIQFKNLQNDFMYKGMLAVYKIIRNDLLIANHLALDLVRDCLVLGMMLRDQSEGTRHHRNGGAGNELVTGLNDEYFGTSAKGILNSIEQSSILFGTLAKEWSETSNSKMETLLGWIETARGTDPCANPQNGSLSC